jgi:acetate kinase
MNILVLNCGSSSIKFAFYEGDEQTLSGVIEKIGGQDAIVRYRMRAAPAECKSVEPVENHSHGLEILLKDIFPRLGDKRIDAVGHRIVHGGERFYAPVFATDEVMRELKSISHLAPLHNPHHIKGVEAAQMNLHGVPNVLVFDTAFYRTIPPEAAIYPLPYRFYVRHKIRRYGFHGTSHHWLLLRTAEIMGRRPEDTKLITCHLGNGCSITAIRNGVAVDTSMGFTPAAGLMMGTRAGDIDPSIITHIHEVEPEHASPKDIDDLLNKQSGLLGISGIASDMRTIIQAKAMDPRAELAFKMFCLRVKRFIGAYLAVLNGADAVVFSAGIGENSVPVREEVLRDLGNLGIRLDAAANETVVGRDGIISTVDSPIKAYVVCTNEELMIARLAAQLLTG